MQYQASYREDVPLSWSYPFRDLGSTVPSPRLDILPLTAFMGLEMVT